MNKRVKLDDLEEEKVKPNPTLPPDMRSEVPPGDPSKQPVTHTQTEMRAVDIATPTARDVFRAKSVFPFDIFPDELAIDEVKISIVTNRFVGTESVNHILIKDIKDVMVNTVPFFAELLIEGPKGIIKIDFLLKNKAYFARRLLLGLMIMSERMVDTSKMEISELVTRAEELGRARK